MWEQIGVFPGWQCDERLWHAGLSSDGAKCFVAGFEDHVYVVWDVAKQEVVWRDDGTDGESVILPLKEWLDASGYVHLPQSPTAERYRIFGLAIHHEKLRSATLHQVLSVDPVRGIVEVRDATSGIAMWSLAFEADSEDWAYASFSDDDSVIAVIEPYSVTFFGRK